METVANMAAKHYIFKGVGSECISVEDKAAVLESTVLSITQSSKHTLACNICDTLI